METNEPAGEPFRGVAAQHPGERSGGNFQILICGFGRMSLGRGFVCKEGVLAAALSFRWGKWLDDHPQTTTSP